MNKKGTKRKKPMGFGAFLVLWVVITILLGIFFTSINKTGQSQESILFTAALLGLGIVFVVFCFKMSTVLSNPKKKKDIKVKKVGSKAFMSNTIVSGLPGAENQLYQTYYYDTKIMIDNGHKTFNLELDKIYDISFKSDVKVHKYVDFSENAVLGTRRLKSVKDVSTYLVIIYESDGEKKEILFDVTYDLKNASQFAEQFRESPYNRAEEIAVVEL